MQKTNVLVDRREVGREGVYREGGRQGKKGGGGCRREDGRERGPVCINKNETKRNSESANTRFEGGYWDNSRRITKTNGGLQKNI